MSGVPNTVRRDGIYHFRRGIPLSLRALLRRRELCCSLKTSDPALARTRSRRLYLQSEALFSLVGSARMLDEGQIQLLVQRFYDFELEEENQLRLSTGVQFDEANRQAAIVYYERMGTDNGRGNRRTCRSWRNVPLYEGVQDRAAEGCN